MVNVDRKVFCYSVFSPEYDLNSLEIGLLSKVRRSFFNLNGKQKNQLVKEVNGKKYHYFYSFEKGKPAKWKKVLEGKLLEKSRINKDNTYSILYQDTHKNLLKISYFNNNHEWLKTEYFNNGGKIVFSRSKTGPEVVVSEYKSGKNNVNTYNIYPLGSLSSINDGNVLDNKVAKFFCLTNFGRISYFAKEQFNEIDDSKVNKCLNNNSDKNLKAVDLKKDNKKMEKINKIKDCLEYRKIIKTEKNEKYFYFGDINDNLRDGFGRTVSESGKTAYEGFYKDDKRNGFGVYYYRSGKICYAGSFLDDKRNGLGIAFNESQNLVQASIWSSGNPGKASVFFDEFGNMFILKNGIEEKSFELISYNQNFNCIRVSSLISDKVTLFNEAGELLYNGQVSDGVRDGFGIEYKTDGSIRYKGNFKNNLYDGNGIIFLDNGNKIEGSFKEGKLNGFAVEFSYKLKKLYEGNFINDIYNGKGKLYLDEGSFIEGVFESGNVLGRAQKFNKDNELLYEGDFKDNTYSGHGVLFKNRKKFYEGNFKNGLYDGFGRIFDKGKCVYSGEFVSGQKCGFGTSFSEIGRKKYTGQWKENQYNGLGILFKDSETSYIGNFKNSKKCGRLNVVYNGQIVKEGIFEDDKLVYVKEYSYPNKNVSYIGNVSNGKKCGMGCQFNEYGEKEFEGIFENGEIITKMRVPLKNIEPLGESDVMKDTEYEKFRTGVDFAVEKEFLGGIYSGELSFDKPNGKGTILYPDHRYIGSFSGGVPCGCGIIYKNNGVKIEGEFFKNSVSGCRSINFDSGVSYNYIEK